MFAFVRRQEPGAPPKSNPVFCARPGLIHAAFRQAEVCACSKLCLTCCLSRVRDQRQSMRIRRVRREAALSCPPCVALTAAKGEHFRSALRPCRAGYGSIHGLVSGSFVKRSSFVRTVRGNFTDLPWATRLEFTRSLAGLRTVERGLSHDTEASHEQPAHPPRINLALRERYGRSAVDEKC